MSVAILHNTDYLPMFAIPLSSFEYCSLLQWNHISVEIERASRHIYHISQSQQFQKGVIDNNFSFEAEVRSYQSMVS